MTTLGLAALAGGAGLGVLIAFAGLTGRPLFGDLQLASILARSGHGLLRAGLVFLAALLVFAATGWVAGGILAAVGAWALPNILGGKARREAAMARTEAIASWTEMVRDAIVAASGLEEAIVATEPIAPAAIAPEVRTLVRRLEHESFPEALVAFGADLDHPSGDLVTAALVLAARMEASDLASLLSRLAEATRGEARMRIRVEIGRAKVRTATKIIVGVVAAAVIFLALVNRAYLASYDSPGGQLMLAVVGGVFALGGWLLNRMSTITLPERFAARVASTGPGS